MNRPKQTLKINICCDTCGMLTCGGRARFCMKEAPTLSLIDNPELFYCEWWEPSMPTRKKLLMEADEKNGVSKCPAE